MIYLERGIAQEPYRPRAAFAPATGRVVVSLVLPGVDARPLQEALQRALPAALVHEDARKRVVAGLPDEVNDLNAVLHFQFQEIRKGLHVLHGKDVMELAAPLAGCIRITMIGDPLRKAMAAYRNARNNPTHPLHAHASAMDVAAFYASDESLLLRNRQCRKIACVENSALVAPDELLRMAKEILQRDFAWVGLEGVSEGQQLQRCLRTHGIDCQNTVLVWPAEKPMHLTTATRDAIMRANSADVRLWKEFLPARRGALARIISWLKK